MLKKRIKQGRDTWGDEVKIVHRAFKEEGFFEKVAFEWRSAKVKGWTMQSLRKEHSPQKHKDRVLEGPECVLVMDQQGGPCVAGAEGPWRVQRRWERGQARSWRSHRPLKTLCEMQALESFEHGYMTWCTFYKYDSCCCVETGGSTKISQESFPFQVPSHQHQPCSINTLFVPSLTFLPRPLCNQGLFCAPSVPIKVYFWIL